MPINVPKIQATYDSRVRGQSATIVLTFGEIEYCLDQTPIRVISFRPFYPSDGPFNSLEGAVLPCTVIDCSKDQLSKDDFLAIRTKFALRDDVWTPSFLAVLILQTIQNSRICVAQHGTLVSMEIKSTHLPTGPYAIRPSSGEILRVSRLYEDDCSAFIGGSLTFRPQLHSFQWLSTGVSKTDQTLAHSLISIRIV